LSSRNLRASSALTMLLLPCLAPDAASAKTTGIDFNVQLQFTMLPEALDGLGVAFTYTSTDGEARRVQRIAPTATTGGGHRQHAAVLPVAGRRNGSAVL
jgi:hypothetical protein